MEIHLICNFSKVIFIKELFTINFSRCCQTIIRFISFLTAFYLRTYYTRTFRRYHISSYSNFRYSETRRMYVPRPEKAAIRITQDTCSQIIKLKILTKIFPRQKNYNKTQRKVRKQNNQWHFIYRSQHRAGAKPASFNKRLLKVMFLITVWSGLIYSNNFIGARGAIKCTGSGTSVCNFCSVWR